MNKLLILLTISLVLVPATFAVKLTDQGLFDSSNNRVYSRAYDVVVCKGNNALDDIWKTLTCDVVCLSTDTDCSQEIQYGLDNGKTVLVAPGTYNLKSTSLFFNYINASLILTRDDVLIRGYGATLVPNYTTHATKHDTVFLVNSSNSKIEGFKIVENNLQYNGADHMGISLINSKNALITNNFINFTNKVSHALWIVCYNGNTRNSMVSHNTLYSYRGDTIGGGDATTGCNISDTNIDNNYIYQLNESSNAFDMVHAYRISFTNNMVYGWVQFGVEITPNTYSMISNNILKSTTKNQTKISLASNTEPTANVIISNNIIENGYLDGYCSNCLIEGNIFINSSNAPGNIFMGTGSSNTIIKSNRIHTVNGIGIKLTHATDSQIVNNIISMNNISNHGISVDGSSSKVQILGNSISGPMKHGIDISTINTALVSNNIINTTTPITEDSIYASTTKSITISNNILLNNNGTGIFIDSSPTYDAVIANNLIIMVNSSSSLGIKVATNYVADVEGNYINGTDTKYSVNTLSYVDNYNLPAGITQTCGNNVFEGKTIHNSTNQCTCISGTWKCINFI